MNYRFFVKAADDAQCISNVAYREGTMRERGIPLKYEGDFTSYDKVVRAEKQAYNEFTEPTLEDPRHHDVCISAEKRRAIFTKKIQMKENLLEVREKRRGIQS